MAVTVFVDKTLGAGQGPICHAVAFGRQKLVDLRQPAGLVLRQGPHVFDRLGRAGIYLQLAKALAPQARDIAAGQRGLLIFQFSEDAFRCAADSGFLQRDFDVGSDHAARITGGRLQQRMAAQTAPVAQGGRAFGLHYTPVVFEIRRRRRRQLVQARRSGDQACRQIAFTGAQLRQQFTGIDRQVGELERRAILAAIAVQPGFKLLQHAVFNAMRSPMLKEKKGRGAQGHQHANLPGGPGRIKVRLAQRGRGIIGDAALALASSTAGAALPLAVTLTVLLALACALAWLAA